MGKPSPLRSLNWKTLSPPTVGPSVECRTGQVGPMANLMVNILGSFAEFERELICDRTRRGRRHKVERRREYLGSNTAFGYQYRRMDPINRKSGRLSVDPDEAQIVRRM